MIAPGEDFGQAPLDSSNRFLVGVRSGYLFILLSPTPTMAIPRLEALNLAAWIVSLADPGGKDFERVMKAIQNL